MSSPDHRRKPLLIAAIVVAGGLAALLAQLGVSNLKAVLPVAAALAAIWAMASVAVARFARRSALLFTPALAAYVLSVITVVYSFDGIGNS